MTAYREQPNFHLKHTCTNVLITEELLHDWLCNLFFKDYVQEQDSVIINSPLLEQYLKKTYPKIKTYIYSATLHLSDIKIINEKTKDNIVVLNYNYNNNDKYLSQLIHPENIEILCAEPCEPNCPNRKQHYESLSKTQLLLPTDPKKDILKCPFNCEQKTFYEIQQSPCAISNARIEKLSQLGFQYFKLSGRNLPPPRWFEIILYYLVKPEYINYVREDFRRS